MISPQSYRKTEFTHRIGLSADKPSASDVLVGTLYYSTDAFITERSNGVAWELYVKSDSNAQTVIQSTLTGTIDNWVPGLSDDTLIIWQGTSDLLINGIVGGVHGQQLTIKNLGNGSIIYLAYGMSSNSLDNLINFATSGFTPLALRGSATYSWSVITNRWDIIQHEQGEWITRVYNAANFTGLSGMTWNVESGDVRGHRYWLSGRTLYISITVVDSDVGGVASNCLFLRIPLGMQHSGILTVSVMIHISDAGSAAQLGSVVTDPAFLTQVEFWKLTETAWTLGSGTNLRGTFPIEVL